MHPPEVKQEALRLVAEGLNDCEIGRRLGIPRRTIRDWRAPEVRPASTFGRELPAVLEGRQADPVHVGGLLGAARHLPR